MIVGAGATGTETAGALAELIRDVMPHEYQDLAVRHARVVLVDLGHTVLEPFSDKAHEYAAKSCSATASSCGWAPRSRRSARTG